MQRTQYDNACKWHSFSFVQRCGISSDIFDHIRSSGEVYVNYENGRPIYLHDKTYRYCFRIIDKVFISGPLFQVGLLPTRPFKGGFKSVTLSRHRIKATGDQVHDTPPCTCCAAPTSLPMSPHAYSHSRRSLMYANSAMATILPDAPVNAMHTLATVTPGVAGVAAVAMLAAGSRQLFKVITRGLTWVYIPSVYTCCFPHGCSFTLNQTCS